MHTCIIAHCILIGLIGAAFSDKHDTHLSVRDLLRHLPEGTALPSLDYARTFAVSCPIVAQTHAHIVALEQEAKDEFTEVTLRQGHPMRIPVSLVIATSHLRVTTVILLPRLLTQMITHFGVE